MTGIASPSLLEKIHRTVVDIPPPVLGLLVGGLQNSGESSYGQIRQAVFQQVPTPEFRDTISDLLEAWQSEDQSLTPQSLAFALASATHSYQKAKAQTATEIVWTGPTTGVLPLRRTEQVLIEMIREAKKELLIVSFAVYDIAEIVSNCARRGADSGG